MAETIELAGYEESLSGDLTWALIEGSLHFEGKSAVQKALRRIASRLSELDIPYAVVGAMAMFRHGYRRFTEDINLLVTRGGLREIHRQLKGRGYSTNFTGSKALRDAEFGVRIEFIVAGEFPGDGKPNPVPFPDPAEVAVDYEGIKYVGLVMLVEMKLASGMTDRGRMKDLADVQEMIKVLRLPREYVEQLNPYVRHKFLELWVSPPPEK